MPRDARALLAVAVLVSLVAQGGLLAALVLADRPSTLGPLLLLVEAFLLGLVFPPRIAMIAAAAPALLFLVGESARRALGLGDSGDAVGTLVGATATVALFLAFLAGMTAAMRVRYFTSAGRAGRP